MSDFGDFDDDDAFDSEPPDPEQVTYKLHGLRVALDELVSSRAGLATWDQLDAPSQAMALGIGEMIVDYIVTHEPETAEELARSLHSARRFVATSPRPPWDELSPDERRIGIDLMDLILAWLRRQGALDAT